MTWKAKILKITKKAGSYLVEIRYRNGVAEDRFDKLYKFETDPDIEAAAVAKREVRRLDRLDAKALSIKEGDDIDTTDDVVVTPPDQTPEEIQAEKDRKSWLRRYFELQKRERLALAIGVNEENDKRITRLKVTLPRDYLEEYLGFI